MSNWEKFTSITELQNGDLIKLNYDGFVDYNEGQNTEEICVIVNGWVMPLQEPCEMCQSGEFFEGYCKIEDGTDDFAKIIEYIPVLPRECKINFDNHPNAIPDGFEVKDSSIHGEGLFTTYKWPCNTRIEISHFNLSGVIYRNGVIGAYLNHSDQPNCEIAWDGQYGYLTSTRAIGSGEELTLNYFNEKCGEGTERINCN